MADRPAEEKPVPPPPIRRAHSVWLFCVLLLLYWSTYSGLLHAVDELSALSVTDSLLVSGSLETPQMEWDQQRTPPQNIFGPDGGLYSKKSIGPSLMALPFYALGKELDGWGAVQLALLANALVCAATAVIFLQIGRGLGLAEGHALTGALLVGIATPLLPYARTLFSEPLAALGLALALFGALTERRNTGARLSPLPVLAAGAGISLLILAKFSNLVAAPFFALYLAVVWFAALRAVPRQTRLYRALLFGASAGLGLAITVAYNWLRFRTLLGFPLEPYELFNTPLLTGLAGQLFSPGKGLFWYMPLAWLVLLSAGWWRREQRWWDAALALSVTAALLVVYALWYDWPGGRAWGPRMVVVVVPAVALLALPALADLGKRSGRGVLVTAIVTLSILVQLPGVLVNFEQQEALDMQVGASFDQLLWSWSHSPLLTYWTRLFSASSDPLWLQPWLGTLPLWLPLSLFLCTAAAAAWLWRQRPGNHAGAAGRASHPAWALLPLAGLAILLPLAAFGDPRTEEQGAVREETAAVMAAVVNDWRDGDLLVLDAAPGSDPARRNTLWMNRAPALPLIGWARRDTAEATLHGSLERWFAGHRRIWLNVQESATDSGRGATETWLASQAFAGRQQWFGGQRLAEFVLAATGVAGTTLPPLAFGYESGPLLTTGSSDLRIEDDWLLAELRWPEAGDPNLRYSLQILAGDGALFAQIDGAPAAAVAPGERIALPLPPGGFQAILKIYRAADGLLLPHLQPAGDGWTIAGDWAVVTSR